MIRAVVTDMDNTLYSWVDYIVPSIEGMVKSLCETTGFPRIKVVQALKEVYERYESNEYPFAIQESRLFEPFKYDFASFDQLVIAPARDAFASARRRYMKPYRGVVSGLQQLKELGIPVVALTDAPRNPAERRVKRMELDQYFVALYTLPAFPFPDSGVAHHIRSAESAGGVKLKCPVVELPRDFEKPDTRGLELICESLGVKPSEVLVIGDSQQKDVLLAQRMGAVDCWAEYGTYRSEEYSERLNVISAPSAIKRNLQQGPALGKPPTHRLSSFELIVPIVLESRRGVTAVA